MINLSSANYKYKESVLNYSKKQSIKISTSLVSNIISEELENYKNNEFIFYDEVNSDIMECISFDTYNLAKLQNSILEKLNKSLFDLESVDNVDLINNNLVFNIPFGLVNKNILLNNFGPDIPICLKLIGDTKCNIDFSIQSQSINTILLKVIICIDLNMRLFIPLDSEDIFVKYDYPLSIKFIQGQIPDAYLGNYPIIS